VTVSTERRSPLAEWSARFAVASTSVKHFSVGELAYQSQINLRGNASDAAFAAAVRDKLGFELPATANTWSGGNERAAIWLGPDEWLLTAPEGEHVRLECALRTALRGIHHSVVDLSANRTVIAISGSDARPVLAKGCSLDLHAAAFAAPQAAQTLLAKAQVILQCADGKDAFRLYVRNSFAQYVAEWLTDAASESAAARALDSERIAALLAYRERDLDSSDGQACTDG
jgi:sarcosine oxidase subunit gamma